VARIERFSDLTGRLLYWLTLAMVLIGSYNAVVRYLGRYIGSDLSSNAYIELQWYLFSLVFLLGAAYTLKEDAHVRVDVLYSRLSERGKAWINLLGTLLFLIPFCALMIWVSWSSVASSWSVLEMSPDPGGLPRYPIKTVIPIGFALLILQGVAHSVKYATVLMYRRSPEQQDERGGEDQ
jgi:TRAP-type mannitol/chloroaromatic compound transport system permease small subunit